MRKVTMIAALLLSVLMFFHNDVPADDEVVYAGDVTIVHRVIPEPIFIDVSPTVTINKYWKKRRTFCHTRIFR